MRCKHKVSHKLEITKKDLMTQAEILDYKQEPISINTKSTDSIKTIESNNEKTNNKNKSNGFNISLIKAKQRREQRSKGGTRYDSFLLQFSWVLPSLFFIGIFVFFSLYMVIKNATNGSERPIYEWYFSMWNFKAILTDQSFIIALRNSLLYVVVTVPIGLAISIACAKALSSVLNKRMFSFVQGIFFLPYVTSAMAVSMAFAFMFTSNNSGIFNSLLQAFGLNPVNWMQDPRYAFVVVMIFGIWKSLPFQIIMLTAAFLRVNKQYYSSASVDGMKKQKQFWKVSIPQIVPTIIYLTTIGLIGAFKVMPLGLFSTELQAETVNAQTIIFWIYERTTGASMNAISYAKAGAASLFLMLIILAVTIVNRMISKKLGKIYK